MTRRLGAFVALSLVLGVCGSRSCGRQARPNRSLTTVASSGPLTAGPSALRVPRAGMPIVPDGQLDEDAWRGAVRTGSFLDQQTGDLARPYSDARLLWDERNLYLALYAADEDIHTASGRHDDPLWLKDAFSVRLTLNRRVDSFGLEFAPNGTLTDFLARPDGSLDRSWESGAVVGVDLDGTINDGTDEDEEWVIEAALPWSSLGASDPLAMPTLTVRFARCDTPRGGQRRCASSGDRALVLVNDLAGR